MFLYMRYWEILRFSQDEILLPSTMYNGPQCSTRTNFNPLIHCHCYLTSMAEKPCSSFMATRTKLLLPASTHHKCLLLSVNPTYHIFIVHKLFYVTLNK